MRKIKVLEGDASAQEGFDALSRHTFCGGEKEKKERKEERRAGGLTLRGGARSQCESSGNRCDALSARAVRGLVGWSAGSNGGGNGIQATDGNGIQATDGGRN